MGVKVFLLALFALLGACASTVRPDPEQIAPWTTQLRAAQPEDAVAAIYVRGGRRLVFIAAQHANGTDSLTFRLIADAYALNRFDTLIAEGEPYSSGPNSAALLDRLAGQREVEGFVEGGETVPAMRGALEQGTKIWGGEPDDAEIRDRMLSQGFSEDDLLGFYTLRTVPQWMREQRIAGPEDPGAPIEAELEDNRRRLGLAASRLPNVEAWRRWYEATNGKPFGRSFVLEEVGPLADGRFATNLIAAGVGRARDAFLLETIARHVNAGESIIVVFGASHFMMLRPALDRMLGEPCYVGADLGSAPNRCLG